MTRGLGRARPAAGILAAGVTLGATVPFYREGPPPAHTGGFGEPTCAECHFGSPLNDDAGTLTLGGPARFEPGRSYRLEVSLGRTEMAAAGFQLAVRFAEGTAAGKPAGTLAGLDGRVAITVDTASGVPYAHQTAPGSELAEPGVARWTLEWTAPDTAAEVTVHVTGNAANDDASEFGDFIYATQRAIAPASDPRYPPRSTPRPFVDGAGAGGQLLTRMPRNAPRTGFEP